MANLNVTASSVRSEYTDHCVIRSRNAANPITAGQAVYMTSTGQVDLLATATVGAHQFLGVALDSAGAGEALGVLESGWVYGFDLSGQAYDAVIYGSDTAGALGSAAGTASVPVGRVDCLNDQAKTKVLRVMPRPATAFA